MADDSEIVAVFKADIEQFKAQMVELKRSVDSARVPIDGLVDQFGAPYKKAVDKAGESVDKFGKSTKSAHGSIQTLSRGLGGVSGLLAITGRLFGVNTEQLQELIFASQQFSQIAKKLADAQKLSALAAKESTTATIAQSAAEKAGNLIKTASLGVWTLVATAIIAATVAIYKYITSQEAELKALEAEIKLNDIQRKHYEQLQILLRDTEKILAINALKEKIRRGEAKESDLDLLQSEQDTQDESLKIIKEFAAEKTHLVLESRKTLEKETRLQRRGSMENATFEEVSDKEAIARNIKRREKLTKDLAALDKAQNKQLGELKKQQASENANTNAEAAKDESDTKKEQEKKAFEESEKLRLEQQKKVIDELTKISEDRKKFTADNYYKLLGLQKKYEEDSLKSLQNAAEKEMEELDKLDQESFNRITNKKQKEAEDLAKAEEKKRLERIEQEQKMLDIIFSAQEDAFNKKQSLLEEDKTAQEKAIDTQRALAERGLGNTLAFEEKRLAELKRQQMQDAARQKRVKMLETFLNSLAEYSKSDPKTAIQKALLQVALATAASAVFAEEGGIIGDTANQMSNGRRHKSGRDVLLHAERGEGIIPVASMEILGKRNFELMRNLHKNRLFDASMPDLPRFSGASANGAIASAEIVSKLSSIEKTLRDQKQIDIDFESYHNGNMKMITHEREKGNKTTTIKNLKRLG